MEMNSTISITIPVKPSTEIPLVLQALQLGGEGGSELYRRLSALKGEDGIFVVHPSITKKDLDAFGPLMSWLEDPIDILFTREEVWRLHGFFGYFYWARRPNCTVTRDFWGTLTHAVGSFDGPAQ